MPQSVADLKRGFRDSIWLNVLNKRVFGYRWLEQLSAGGVNWANDAVEQTGENEERFSGVCSVLLPLQATAAVSEAFCTAFTNAMAEFSEKLPMTEHAL